MNQIRTINTTLENNLFYYKSSLLFFLFALTAFLFCFGITLSRNNDFMNAVALATTVKPETFTELYFENHTNLPKTAVPGESYAFSFTIHNLEYQTVEYPYVVTVNDLEGNSNDIVKQSVKLDHDEYRTVNINYDMLYPIERAKISVTLTNKNQAIHFWMNKKGKE